MAAEPNGCGCVARFRITIEPCREADSHPVREYLNLGERTDGVCVFDVTPVRQIGTVNNEYPALSCRICNLEFFGKESLHKHILGHINSPIIILPKCEDQISNMCATVKQENIDEGSDDSCKDQEADEEQASELTFEYSEIKSEPMECLDNVKIESQNEVEIEVSIKPS